ncbi:hypothetical protein Q668_00280 [Alcanivorax sp. PN-3]|nr:hypothetical protein Q668_00280 [Alcanivorax sp. PN-3]
MQNVRTEMVDVQDRLTQLGLTLAALQEAVQQGYLARARLTSNHPRIFFGSSMWAETVAALRDNLRSDGWVRSNEGNYELTVNRAEDLAVVVTTGDEATGVATSNPTNKCPKGINTVDAIAVNNQLDMFGELIPDPGENLGFTTWILLIHVGEDEVRSELSLPSNISSGKIKAWKERIILPALPREDDIVEVRPPELPDIDVPIKRKA